MPFDVSFLPPSSLTLALPHAIPSPLSHSHFSSLPFLPSSTPLLLSRSLLPLPSLSIPSEVHSFSTSLVCSPLKVLVTSVEKLVTICLKGSLSDYLKRCPYRLHQVAALTGYLTRCVAGCAQGLQFMGTPTKSNMFSWEATKTFKKRLGNLRECTAVQPHVATRKPHDARDFFDTLFPMKVCKKRAAIRRRAGGSRKVSHESMRSRGSLRR